MTATMRDLIMDKITRGLTSRGWVVAVDHLFSNQGVVRVLNDETLAPMTEAWFKFGDEGCDFKATKDAQNGLAGCYYEPGRYRGSAPWRRDTPAEVVHVVILHLTGCE